MKCQLAGALICCLVFLSIAEGVFAQNKNIYGVHLSSPSVDELNSASLMINSKGGAWGKVTVAVNKKQCKDSTLQTFFNEARRKRIIPLVRLTQDFDNSTGFYQKPQNSGNDAKEWADCLGNLNWPTRDRHVILFNEVNHAAEFGGVCDGGEYARVADYYIDVFTKKSPYFVLMLSPLDLYAPQAKNFCDAGEFFSDMKTAVPDIFDKAQAHASHCYPANNYSASATATGRYSIACYRWELNYLKSLGVTNTDTIPVYITETGWKHSVLSESEVAQRTAYAYDQVWSRDSRVAGVTPFILSYCDEPFVSFSFRKCEQINGVWQQASGFRPVFTQLFDLPKQAEDPLIIETFTVDGAFPRFMIKDSNYKIHFTLKNEGQGICDARAGCELRITDSAGSGIFSKLYGLIPGLTSGVDLTYFPQETLGRQEVKVGMYKGEKLVLELFSWNPEVLPAQVITARVREFPGAATNTCDLELQLFDPAEALVFKKRGVCVDGGIGYIDGISNIALFERYRAVILRRGYLPVQTFVTFTKTANEAEFPVMLPVDRNGDGRFSFADFF